MKNLGRSNTYFPTKLEPSHATSWISANLVQGNLPTDRQIDLQTLNFLNCN